MNAEHFAHSTAIVDDGAKIGAGTKIWHFSHVFSGAEIGNDCSFGQNTMVASDVKVGGNVKVQNNVAIYGGTTIEDDVFLGPSCVLTNISNPRSQVSRRTVYERTSIRRGATVGANATIVCGIELGRYCFIAAGAVVTKSVKDYALIAGVPGKQVGWMSRHGHRLNFDEQGNATCPESEYRYSLTHTSGGDVARCLDIAEEECLPESKNVGHKSYREFVNEE